MTWRIAKKSQMTQAQWAAFAHVLKRIDARKAAKILADDVVTDKEMNALLDRNADGKVTYQDFGSFTHPLFRDIKRFLYAYDFSAYRLWKPTTGNLPSVPYQFWSDADFVRNAVYYDDRLVKYASRDVALEMIYSDAARLKYVKSSLREDRNFILAAVKKNSRALKYAGEFRKDEGVVRAALRGNASALRFADASLKKDEEFMLAAMKEGIDALKYADVSLKKDRVFFLLAMQKDRRALGYAHVSLKKDKAFLLILAKSCPYILHQAHISLQKDKKFVLAVVRRLNQWSINTLPKPLRSDKAFVLDLLKLGPYMLMVDRKLSTDRQVVARYLMNQALLKKSTSGYASKLKYYVKRLRLQAVITEEDCKDDAAAIAAVWRLVRTDAELKKFFTQAELTNRATLLAALKKKYNIAYPGRLRDVAMLVDVLRNRATAHAPKDKRPLCVFVCATADHNGAFKGAGFRIKRMRRLGFRVVYYEANDEDAARKALEHGTAKGRHRAKLIVISGHGNPRSLAFGGYDPASARARARNWFRTWNDLYMDVGDFLPKDKFQLARYITHDGDIVLGACSTGKGGSANPRSLANLVARTLPKGVRLHAARKASGLIGIGMMNKRIFVTWKEKDCAYMVHGSKPTPVPPPRQKIAVRSQPRLQLKPKPVVKLRPKRPRRVASTTNVQRFYPFGSKLFGIEVTTRRKPEPSRPAASPRVVPKRPVDTDTDTDVEF